jgi:meso-butanediol dehydrogenase/(S,S)-butanediol dehydrogenase/diacetyl reductase
LPGVALIIGASSGIGAATARRLVADGCSVCLLARRAEPLAELVAEFGEEQALALAADVAEPDAAERLVAAALKRFGGIDSLVYCAGTGAGGAVAEQTLERWNRVLETNLTGAFGVCRAAIPHLLERRGAIVTVASLAGLRVSPASAAYCTSKAALIMLTQSIALDYGPLGLRANCVCPGWIRTPMADAAMLELCELHSVDREGAYALAAAHVPARRPGEPGEVADAIAWLLSPGAAFVNGAVLPIDGGSAIVDCASLAFSAAPGPRGAVPGGQD